MIGVLKHEVEDQKKKNCQSCIDIMMYDLLISFIQRNLILS